LAPFASAVARLDEIPGIGPTAAAVIMAEIGVDMTRFQTSAHLSSWAKFAPGVKESAGRKKGNGATGHGNRYLARDLGEAAVSVGSTDTFLGERYRRIARRRGKKRAIVAVARSILAIAWHLLGDDNAHFRDLGTGHDDSRINLNHKMRNHLRKLQALGCKVTPEPAARTHRARHKDLDLSRPRNRHGKTESDLTGPVNSFDRTFLAPTGADTA
jgi:transposase